MQAASTATKGPRPRMNEIRRTEIRSGFIGMPFVYNGYFIVYLLKCDVSKVKKNFSCKNCRLGSLELKISGALPKISLAPSCFKGCHLTLWTRWEGWKSHSCEGRIRSQLKYRKAVQILPFACWIFATLCCVCTDRSEVLTMSVSCQGAAEKWIQVKPTVLVTGCAGYVATCLGHGDKM